MGNENSKAVKKQMSSVDNIDFYVQQSSNKTAWTELSTAKTCFHHHFSCPVFLNSNEIIMASSNTESNDDDITIQGNSENIFGIYKYNIQTGESKLFIPYTEKQAKLIGTLPVMKYDKKTRKIFIFTQNTATLMIIDINSNSYKVIDTEYNDAYYIDGAIENARFHIICRVNSLNYLRTNAIHLQWLDVASSFEEVYQFEGGMKAFRPKPYIHHLKSKNALLVICNDGNLYMFDLETRIWHKLSIWITLEIGYAAIVTNDDRYLIVIKKKIQVIDLNIMEMMVSKIKAPNNSYWYYAASYHDHRDELLISGYIKQVWIDQNINIPTDITDLIIQHYNTEWIYLFQQHDSLTPKWKILADDIISSCQPMFR